MNKKYFLLIFIPILFFMLYYGSIKPLKASRAGVKKEIEKTLNYNTFVNHEFRKIFSVEALNSQDFDLILLAKEEMEKNVLERPLDLKSHIILAVIYYSLGDKTKTLESAEKALELAPNRPDVQEFYKDIKKKESH
jgi:Tfp pilus assembly protein PilF